MALTSGSSARYSRQSARSMSASLPTLMVWHILIPFARRYGLIIAVYAPDWEANAIFPPMGGLGMVVELKVRSELKMPTQLGPRKCMSYSVSYTHLRAHETRHDLVCR